MMLKIRLNFSNHCGDLTIKVSAVVLSLFQLKIILCSYLITVMNIPLPNYAQICRINRREPCGIVNNTGQHNFQCDLDDLRHSLYDTETSMKNILVSRREHFLHKL